MTSTFKIEKPDAVDMTLTVTMSLADWKRLKSQLESSQFPSWKMAQSIDQMIRKGSEQFSSESEYK